MREFIHYENIRHYLRLLDRTMDLVERGHIMNLAVEELVNELEKQRRAKTEKPDEDENIDPVH